ncbi:iron chaperone [Salmonirosea aquatica]|uniref:YdhG-like domain-containing protein n=1 Tax=Salmonirosea aquatica TaxID=2654236 RepID=A0A7C9FP51_9BACT|nr:hypothetical protein [Cytophagaceae bacterium SJW1-29]
MNTVKPENVAEYIAGFPKETQLILEQIRTTISKTCPDAEEKISYGMPTFTHRGKVLVHFAAFKNHIGFYATPTGHEAFREEFSRYKTGKGSARFPLDEPMPLDLIDRIVKFRMK